MSTLTDYYNSGADKSDPLIRIVHDRELARNRLANLKGQTYRYLVPVATKDGSYSPAFDLESMIEVEKLATDIDNCTSKIEKLEAQITRLDAILSKYDIERPSLREIKSDIAMRKKFLDSDRARIAAALSQALMRTPDESKAKKDPDYLKAVSNQKRGKSMHEPAIARLEQCVAELEDIIKSTN